MEQTIIPLMQMIIALLIGAFILTIYFIPTLAAISRNTKRIAGIIIVNLFLGWTLLGWFGALLWAVLEKKKE